MICSNYNISVNCIYEIVPIAEQVGMEQSVLKIMYPCVTANQVFSFLSFAEALYELFSVCKWSIWIFNILCYVQVIVLCFQVRYDAWIVLDY